jgi:hypothetical protein
MSSARVSAALVVAVFGATACASVLGADFDGLSLGNDAGAQSGGAAGASSGGTAGSHTGGGAGTSTWSVGGFAGSGAAPSGGSGGSGGTGGSAGATGGTGGSAGGGVVNGVVLNEMRNTSGDYVELYNTDGVAFDLGGYGLTDMSGSGPDLAGTERFPVGTSILPHAYVLVLCNMTLPISSGPTTNCSGLPSPCYLATFGVSQAGETVYLVSPQNQVVDSTPVPGDLSASVSWGRLPNGGGAFTYTRATPMAVNQGP